MKSFKIYLKTIFDRKKHPLSKILSSFFSGVLLLFLISILPFEKGIYGRNNSFMDHKCVTLSKTLPGINYMEKKDLDYCIEKAGSQAEDIKTSWSFRNRIKDVKTTYYTDTDIGITVFFDETTHLDDLGKIALLNSQAVPTDVISVITDQYEENNIKNPNDLRIRETKLLKENGINYQVLLKKKETVQDYITCRLTSNSTVIFVPLSLASTLPESFRSSIESATGYYSIYTEKELSDKELISLSTISNTNASIGIKEYESMTHYLMDYVTFYPLLKQIETVGLYLILVVELAILFIRINSEMISVYKDLEYFLALRKLGYSSNLLSLSYSLSNTFLSLVGFILSIFAYLISNQVIYKVMGFTCYQKMPLCLLLLLPILIISLIEYLFIRSKTDKIIK